MKKLTFLIFLFNITLSGYLYAEPQKITQTKPKTETKVQEKKIEPVKKKKEIKKEEPKIILIEDKKEPTADEILTKLYNIYLSSRNLQCRYEQTVSKFDPDKLEFSNYTSKGKISSERHFYANWTKLYYRLIWDIEKPIPYQLITNRKKVWMYNPISQIVKIQRFEELNQATQFVSHLILGRLKLNDHYTAHKSLESIYKLELTPKDRKSPFISITLVVDPIQYFSKKIILETNEKTKYEIEFTSFQNNLPNPAPELEVFSNKNDFIIPRGVIVSH
ncbi:MAG: outer membrane lipoprotein carrier protein LolA [Deltaproteobacteria bacterium]|nr:outer membrane lipoprotein carrier protein LolA [Deltaproteobacteria bacterium]